MDFTIDTAPQTDTLDTADRPLVPAGTHTLTIRSVSEGPNEYKRCDENPEGNCIKLRLASDGNHRFVFDDIPAHLAWRAQQLAAAVGIIAVAGKLTLRPDELEGQKVSVEITHYTSKAGKVSAVVKRYLPAAATPEPRSAARRTNAQKVVAALPDDDIPF
jgi:hypothetical protein